MAEQLLNATDYAELLEVESEFLHERASVYRYQSVASPTGGVTQQWALQQSNIPAGRELIRHPIPYSFVNGQFTVVVPVWLEFAALTDVRAQDRVLYNDGTWYQVLGQPGTTTDEIYRRGWGVVLLPGAIKPASLEPSAAEMHDYISKLVPEPGVVIPMPGQPEEPLLVPSGGTEPPATRQMPASNPPADAPAPPLSVPPPPAPVEPGPVYRVPPGWVPHV